MKRFSILRSPAMVAWAMSSALIGCLFGALASGMLSGKVREETSACPFGVPVHGQFDWNRNGCYVRSVPRLANIGRRGDWPRLEPVADVHRGGRAGRHARATGLHDAFPR